MLIPREILFGNPEKRSPHISPDGTRLTYLAPSDGKMGVWIRTLGADDARVVAIDPERPIPWAAWQGDGAHVLYLQDRGGNENYHLFQVDPATQSARELTPGNDVRALPIAIDHRFPHEALVQLNQRDPRLMDVARVDLRSGHVELEVENPGDVIAWVADDAFVVRAALAQLADGSTCIRVRDDAGDAWRVLDTFPSEDPMPQPVSFEPDGRLNVICAKDANANRLVRYDLSSGSYDVVFEDARYDVSAAYVDPASRTLRAVAVLRDRLTWYAIDPSFGSTIQALASRYDGDFTIEDATADGTQLIVRYTFDDGPNRYYVVDARSGEATFLFADRPALEKYKLAKMRPISFAARDGLEIHGYLTLPNDVAAKSLPTVLYVHGGPWHRDRWGYDDFAQWLANRGYAVLQVNFRGSTGYGKAFLNAGDRQFAGTMRTDLLDARDWAVAEGFADPKRFAILGGSYGGYAVLAALAFTPDAFTCGVDIVGPSNLNTLIASIPPYWEPIRKLFEKRVGDDPEFLNAQSPLFRAHDIRAPLLIAHGANDPRVKQQESDQIVGVLRKNGTPVTYLVFEDEGHGFANPENNKRFTALAETFLSENLGGRLQPVASDESYAPFLR